LPFGIYNDETITLTSQSDDDTLVSFY